MTAALAMFALGASACAPGVGGPGGPTPAAEPLDGAWELTGGMIDGVAIELVDGHRVTLVIEGSTVGGVAACNHYGGELVTDGDAVRIDAFGMTEMACAEPAMALEAAYIDALLRVEAITRSGDELVARAEGVELAFALRPPPPTADLVETRWILESLVSGEVVASPMGEPANLELRADGTFSGSTGCRSFSGEWIENGDEIDTPRWGMDGRVCPAELEAQDRHVVDVIGDGFAVLIDGDRLVISDQSGLGLAYRAEE